jgi:hypothetical protein
MLECILFIEIIFVELSMTMTASLLIVHFGHPTIIMITIILFL